MKNSIIILVLAAVTAFSFWLVRNLEEDLAVTEVKKPLREEITAHDVSAHYFDENKKLKYLVKSKVVTDYSNDFGTSFSYPEVYNYDDNRLSWTAEAENGILSSDKNYLTLTTNVKFVDDPDGEKPLLINGSVIHYAAPEHTISSDKPSVIDNGAIRQTSEQFLLNTEKKTIDFDESIKGRFQTTADEGEK